MNMTGDPNQSSRPSVLGIPCSYPTPDDWNTFSQPNRYLQENDFCQFSPPAAPANNYSFYSNFGPLPSSISFPMPVQQTNDENLHRISSLRCKRKTDSPIPVVAKQHITEERMAEHLSRLHISSENPAPTTEPETHDCREKRLYMCEEMRKLQTDPILPPSLFERINSPCKALVLWTPPRRPFCVSEQNSDSNNNNNNNNNEEEVPDNNLMDLDR